MPPTDRHIGDTTPPSPEEKRRRAQAVARGRLEAMRGRARKIRRSVAAGAAALFVVAFLGVYVQLAAGHDPALDAAAKRRAAATLKASTSSSSASSGESESGSAEAQASEASSGTESSSSESGSPSEEGSQESSSPSSVTTSQS